MALTLVSLKWETGKEFTGRPPSPRQGHALAAIDNAAYIFGGTRSVEEPERGTFYFRDLHKLCFGKILRWEKVRAVGEVPVGRHDHALCAVERMLYMFGGRNELNAEESLPGVYAFNTKTCKWRHLQTHGVEPRSLNSGWAAVGPKIFVIGGIVKGEAHCDVDVLDTEAHTWTKLSVTGQLPSPRCDHRLVAVGSRIFMFGGTGGKDKWYNDLHLFDADTLEWSTPFVNGTPPPPRGCHSLTLHGKKDIYVFGGCNDNMKGKATFDDLHKLSLAKMKWKRPFYSGVPPSRRYGHVACTWLNYLYVFGGTNEETDYSDVKAAKLINPSNRKPLKVSPDVLHNILYGNDDGTGNRGQAMEPAILQSEDTMPSSSSAAEDQEHTDLSEASDSDSSASSSSSSYSGSSSSDASSDDED